LTSLLLIAENTNVAYAQGVRELEEYEFKFSESDGSLKGNTAMEIEHRNFVTLKEETTWWLLVSRSNCILNERICA
jgi:hypothetical protein